jgi:hypothetical protein
MSQLSRLIPTSGPGSGTVTSITFNGGLTSTPDPVTTTGTATIDQTNLTVLDGTVYWDTGTQLLHTTATGTAGQVLTSNGTGAAPTYQNASASGAVMTLHTQDGNNVTPTAGVINISGGNSLTTTGTSGPNTATISLTGITQYNVQTGGVSNALNNVAPSATSGVPLISQGSASQPIFGTAVVAGGGTGDTSFTAYSVITGGTTSTGALQNVSGVGTSGQVLTSQGAGALPQWANAASGGITTIDGDSGSITGSTVTIKAGVSTQNCGSSVKFVNSGATSTLNVTDANDNTLIGNLSGNATLSGQFNTGIGLETLTSLTSGASNMAMGQAALNSLSSGSNNVAYGQNAGLQITTGSFSTFIGGSSGFNYTSSESSNICIGYNTQGTVSESHVLRIGNGTGSSTAGNIGKAVICGIAGVNVGSVATVVTESGDQLGTAVLTAGSNITITPGANTITIAATGGGGGGISTIDGDSGSVTGSTVTFTGLQTDGQTVEFSGSGSTMSFIASDANGNTAIGQSITGVSTSTDSVAIGYQSAASSSSVSIGQGAQCNSATQSVALGEGSACSNSTCIAIGYASAAGPASAGNISIGANSNANNNCISIGSSAGMPTGNGIGIGSSVSDGGSTGCILIGNSVSNAPNGYTNVIAIGNSADLTTPTGSSPIVIGTTANNDTFINGIFNNANNPISANAVFITSAGEMGITVSSERFKQNIQDMSDASSDVLKLRPVTFTWKKDTNNVQQMGLIAEEVSQVLPDLVNLDANGLPFSVKYHDLPAMLLNELQKALKRIEVLEEKINGK